MKNYCSIYNRDATALQTKFVTHDIRLSHCCTITSLRCQLEAGTTLIQKNHFFGFCFSRYDCTQAPLKGPNKVPDKESGLFKKQNKTITLSKSKVVKVNEYFVEPVRSHKVPSQMKELHS